MKNLVTPIQDYDKPLPQEIQDKIKPLTTPVLLRWVDRKNVVALTGSDEKGWTRKEMTTIGTQNILTHWSFTYQIGKVQERFIAGFFNGFDTDLNPQFKSPAFTGGTLLLQPGDPNDEEVWAKIQIHPSFRENVLNLKPGIGPYRFYIDDIAKKEEEELLRLKTIGKARRAVEDLEKTEMELVMKNLGCESELALYKFAETDPATVLTSVAAIGVISVRDIVEKSFNAPYAFLVVDATTSQILWAEGRKPVFKSTDSTVDIREEFSYYLTGLNSRGKGTPSPTAEAKAKLKTITKKIAEIDDALAESAEAEKKLREGASGTGSTVTL